MRGPLPQSTLFAVALTGLTELLLVIGTVPLLGHGAAEVVLVLLTRLACLLLLGLAGVWLLTREPRAVRTLYLALAVLWLSVLLEGLLVWRDLAWYLDSLADDPYAGTLVGCLLLSAVLVVLTQVAGVRGEVANNERPGHDEGTTSPE